jgi:hypothetical protein
MGQTSDRIRDKRTTSKPHFMYIMKSCLESFNLRTPPIVPCVKYKFLGARLVPVVSHMKSTAPRNVGVGEVFAGSIEIIKICAHS